MKISNPMRERRKYATFIIGRFLFVGLGNQDGFEWLDLETNGSFHEMNVIGGNKKF